MSEDVLQKAFPNHTIVTNMTWEELRAGITRNGVKDELEFIYFADAEHHWYCQSHYLFVKWWERTYPVVISSVKYYFENMPFLFVWLLGVFLWFFIELTNNAAEFFNLKHSSMFYKNNFLYYGVATKKLGEIFFKNILLKFSYRVML